MKLNVISYDDLLADNNSDLVHTIHYALHESGIIGVKNIPQFIEKSKHFLDASRQFSYMDGTVKRQYAPDRDIGHTEGYELGAEHFKDEHGKWLVDDKKASYYAYVADNPRNKWPTELDLRTPYLNLAQLMFDTGKRLLDVIGINESMAINHDQLVGYGRMLHYHKESDSHTLNAYWCGAHLDHGLFTALMPAYYYKDGVDVEEPDDAGLYIKPTNGNEYEKVDANDKSVLYFQVGEFAQLASSDKICATKHLVKKAQDNIDRFTLAVFFDAADDTLIQSTSKIAQDNRYVESINAHDKVSYLAWSDASYARYHAK